MKTPKNKRLAPTHLLVLAALLVAAAAFAVPFHQPTVDGVINRDGTDWDAADLVVDDIDDDDLSRTANVRRLLCTWTADSLYLAVTYQDFGDDEALKMYLDLDRGVGPNDATGLQGVPGNFLMPEDHRFEMILARSSLDGGDVFGGPPPASYLVTDDDGSVDIITADVLAAQQANTGAKFPFWANAEFAIPWSAIYPDQTGTVPPHAVIKAVAIAAVASPDSNGYDSAPSNEGMNGDGEQVLLANLHASVIDADGDGEPDAADGTISGTVTLPSDPGTGGVTVTAEMIGFAGREPGAPLSVVTTADGVRDYTLPRLPAGQYRVTYEALGYFAAEQIVDVAQSQQVTGSDPTLEKATAIGGTISFASGLGGAGQVVLQDSGGTPLDSVDFTAAGGPYTFYIEEGGEFTVSVTADTYLPQQQVITVTTGVDVLDVNFALLRETEVSGTIGFESGPGNVGTVRFLDDQGTELDSSDFPFSGGTFQFYTAESGNYTLSTSAKTYVPVDTLITVVAGTNVTDIPIVLPRAPLISGTVAFEGPDAAGFMEVYENDTGAWRDSLSFAADGDLFEFYLEAGQYRLELEAVGYQDRSVVFDVALSDTSLGAIDLTAVRATHLEIIDDEGEILPEARATKYNPATDPFTSTRVLMAARDDEGNDDLYDIDGRLVDFQLTARKMDDLSAPTGNPVFYRSGSEADIDSVVSFANGRAEFWMSNTQVEVLRVYLAQPNKEPIAGRIVVAFLDPSPYFVLLTADRTEFTADNVEVVTVTAKLFDSALNESRVPDTPVTFSQLNSSTGSGQFDIPTTVTNADGEAVATLRATGAGALHISATVVINNRTLEVVADELGSGETYLDISALPGVTDGWRLNLPGSQADATSPVTVTAQTIDRFGNDTADQGQSITFSADPPELGSFDPETALSDVSGRATSVFTPVGDSGVVTIGGDGGGLKGDQTGLQLRNVIVVNDPVWYEEPLTRQTFDKTDLTALIVDNTPEELVLEIPFSSDWDGLQLHVVFETNFDAAGATRDPFEMPVNYGHDMLPDYVLTSKYSANDYGDFRRWNGSGWDFWNPTTGDYGSDGNIQGTWVEKGGDAVMIRIPSGPFGTTFPDSMMLEVYLTQEDGDKRSAFDSAPLDSTLNLTFDYEDPEPGDWDSTKGPVTLLHYGPTYVIKTDFPTPPTVTDVIADPAELEAGATLLLTAIVTDAGDGIGDVLADLSAMGGSALARMYDDGDPNHGDLTAGDGLYSLLTLVPLTNPGGKQDLVVQAFDAGNVWANRETTTIDVTAQITPIVVALDPSGDDHGPNQSGRTKMFYTYPTNIAFVDGAFDLTGLTIYETVANVGGEMIDMIAFQVSMVDFPDPADPGTADWSPLYADMNITKIDILIDSAPGGATATLPWRQAAFQPWDAWDYAVIMDGWYKALIPSQGQNTIDSWRQNALRNDQDILLISDPDADTVTALVSRAALNDPTIEDIKSWDICVAMCSHDFGGEEVLGGIRWVHESRSEWQFGGGHQESNDSNYMDLLLVPGAGHSPGLPQEEILDYESPQAIDRQAALLTPVAIEMSAFEDTGPPVIDTGGGESVVTQVSPIDETPLALSLNIVDDNFVDRATFRYRSTGYEGDGWDREVPMGYLGRNRWVVDILPSWLDSNLVYSPIDSTRYLEFEVEATDALDKASISPVTTLQIQPNRLCRPSDGDIATPDLSLLQIDGSVLLVPERTARIMTDLHMEEAWPGEPVHPDSTQPAVELQWDVCNIEESVQRAPVIPEGRPLGVFRQIFLATADTMGGYIDYYDKLPGGVQLSLHYPQEWVPKGLDENLISLYEYNPQSHRWILVGGNVTPTGNNVTASINRAATYGLFATDAANYNPGEVISGITLSPNPFSPNGDDLYDETNISFYLSQEATITVEIYNIEGNRKQVLAETFPFSGSDITDPEPRRISGIIWDGRDFNGKLVPYGIYVVRVIATYTQAGVTRSVRSNHSLAVIR